MCVFTLRWRQDTRGVPNQSEHGWLLAFFIEMEHILAAPRPRWVFVFLFIVGMGMVTFVIGSVICLAALLAIHRYPITRSRLDDIRAGGGDASAPVHVS